MSYIPFGGLQHEYVGRLQDGTAARANPSFKRTSSQAISPAKPGIATRQRLFTSLSNQRPSNKLRVRHYWGDSRRYRYRKRFRYVQ